jgi:hypothetical protein
MMANQVVVVNAQRLIFMVNSAKSLMLHSAKMVYREILVKMMVKQSDSNLSVNASANLVFLENIARHLSFAH